MLCNVLYYCVTIYYFSQEGWRLEHDDPTDVNSPVVFKGVVFNEMKGYFVSTNHSALDTLRALILHGML